MTDVAATQDDLPVTGTITEREARAAVLVLQQVASEYNRTITYADLKEAVGVLAHRPSNQPIRAWASRVLYRVIEICEADGHPRLTSLVVRASDGGVGSGFNAILERSGQARIEDPLQLEVVAAQERLNCYRQYCPNLPEDAEPTLTREYKAHVARRNKPEPRARPVCATCGYQLPATGICDACD
ncbi:hypothetical protein [Arthrobacter sp. MDT1-65]